MKEMKALSCNCYHRVRKPIYVYLICILLLTVLEPLWATVLICKRYPILCSRQINRCLPKFCWSHRCWLRCDQEITRYPIGRGVWRGREIIYVLHCHCSVFTRLSLVGSKIRHPTSSMLASHWLAIAMTWFCNSNCHTLSQHFSLNTSLWDVF